MERKHKRITEGMSDRQRYRVLKDRILTVAECHPEKLADINVDIHELETSFKKRATPIIRKIVDEFGLIQEYQNEDIELSFDVTKHTFKESISKQKGSFENYGKMLTCFGDVINNAVGVEVHENRYRKDSSVKRMFTLISGFKDDKNIVPVKLEVKEIENKVNKANKLYLAVALEPIQKATVRTQIDHKGASYARVASFKDSSTLDNISISKFAKNINPVDGNFLKYFPDKMLSSEQKAAKAKALVAEEKYTKAKMTARELKQSIRNGTGKDVNEVQKTFAGSPAGAPEPPKITQRKSLSKTAVKKPQKLL